MHADILDWYYTTIIYIYIISHAEAETKTNRCPLSSFIVGSSAQLEQASHLSPTWVLVILRIEILTDDSGVNGLCMHVNKQTVNLGQYPNTIHNAKTKSIPNGLIGKRKKKKLTLIAPHLPIAQPPIRLPRPKHPPIQLLIPPLLRREPPRVFRRVGRHGREGPVAPRLREHQTPLAHDFRADGRLAVVGAGEGDHVGDGGGVADEVGFVVVVVEEEVLLLGRV